MDAWFLWDEEVNDCQQKSTIASLQGNHAKMEEQIEKIKLGENKCKVPSKPSGAAHKSLYPSLVPGAIAPVLPLYPDPPVVLDTPPYTPGGAGLKELQDPCRDTERTGSVLVVGGSTNVCMLLNLERGVCVCMFYVNPARGCC